MTRTGGAALLLLAVLLGAGLAACGTAAPDGSNTAAADRSEAAGVLQPALATEAVTDDPDDPAIWIDAADPARSLILGTNKVAAPGGAVVVFGLDGRVRQTIAGIDRPNNVDVEYGFRHRGVAIDIAVVTERLQHRLRVFRIDGAAARIEEIGVVPVLEGETGERREPMGIALYRRPGDGVIFAIVAPKTGGATDYLWQYRLSSDDDGHVRGEFVRRFGAFSGRGPEPGEAGEIEAVAVDDALGYVYYADERHGIHKWHADPAHAEASRELAVFGLEGYQGDREGLAVYGGPDGRGFVVSVDQVERGASLKVYRREGEAGDPHRHELVATVPTASDETDGLEATLASLPRFPAGIVVMMNSGPKNFLIYDWNRVVSSVK
jgi:3-phytase